MGGFFLFLFLFSLLVIACINSGLGFRTASKRYCISEEPYILENKFFLVRLCDGLTWSLVGPAISSFACFDNRH